MTIGQAVDSFRIFTGLEPDAQRMREYMGLLLEAEDAPRSRARKARVCHTAAQTVTVRLLLLADTHVPKRARDLPARVWDEVDRATW